jgi:hypothetical protein
MAADGPTVYDLATGAIALLSLGVSAYNARRQKVRDTRAVTVECRYSFAVGPIAAHAPEKLVSLEVLNEGLRPVQITGVGFLLADGRQPIVMPVPLNGPLQFPATLADGASETYFFDLAELEAAEAQVGQEIKHGFASASGKRYKGKYVKH